MWKVVDSDNGLVVYRGTLEQCEEWVTKHGDERHYTEPVVCLGGTCE